MHIVRQSYSEKLQNEERNIIPGCRQCHELFDNGKVYVLFDRYKWKVKAVIERMKELDYHYAYRFATRNLIKHQWKEIFKD